MIEYQIEILKRLKKSNILTYEEILKIADAFQIASGQGYAIGKTKGILDYLEKYGEINVSNLSNNKLVIQNKYDLSAIFNEIDKYISIETDLNFNQYF
jgi:translation initiation factor 2 beta subunit (eIF-2beta)/eIF-5